ncbi:MAG: hypothetical protein ACE5JI_06740, partial [Acidobacteriota bacterium]
MEGDSQRPYRSTGARRSRKGRRRREEPDQKTAKLLRHGGELFRARRYQQAIHVWTRVLFLDRGNTAARRAIERAKRAIAEQQRQLDVLVAEAARCLDEGDRVSARHQLVQVLSLDPRHSEGRSLLEKLQTLDRRGEPRSVAVQVRPSREPGSRRRRHRVVRGKAARSESPSVLKVAAFLFSAVCLFAAGGLYLYLNWDFLVSDRAFAPARRAGTERFDERDLLPVPSPAELHYYNGVRLYAKGRYREALQELARV